MGKEDTFAFRRERPCTKSPPSHHERVHHFLLFLCHECLLCLRASSVSRSVCSTSITYESAREKLGRQFRNIFPSIELSEITRIRTHARAHTCMYAYTCAHAHSWEHGCSSKPQGGTRSLKAQRASSPTQERCLLISLRHTAAATERLSD